jgi:ankyrin repeat protein
MSEQMPASEKNPNELMKELDRVLNFGTPEDLFALFDNGMDINQTDFEGRTALQIMTVKGKKEVVEELISRGADVNHVFMYQGRIPFSALDAAEQTKKPEIADLLRSHGAKLGKELKQS